MSLGQFKEKFSSKEMIMKSFVKKDVKCVSAIQGLLKKEKIICTVTRNKDEIVSETLMKIIHIFGSNEREKSKTKSSQPQIAETDVFVH